MEKGDLFTLVGGVIIVLVIAVIANPHYLEGFSPAPKVPVPATVGTVIPTLSATPFVPVTPLPSVTAKPEPTIAPPTRLFYSNNPFSYPKYKMPENMGIFGAGDLTLRGRELIPFAFVSESRGGVTQKFTIPYPVWVINTTVIANRTPQYGNFRMVLCYAGNGTVIDGEEILNRGSMSRVIETSGTEMYMIVTTAYIDSYRIEFNTPRDYYESYTGLRNYGS